MHIVWFKRDLRVHDHPALLNALSRGPVLALYVYEPALLAAPDVAAQHVGFVNECLLELRVSLACVGLPLVVRTGDMPQVLADLHADTPIAGLYSHEETGNGLSFARDLAVAAWCQATGTPWVELPQNAVVRRLRSRNAWSAHWLARMSPEPLPPPWRQGFGVQAAAHHVLPGDGLRSPADLGLASLDKALRQRGGRRQAVALLSSFLDGPGRNYRRGMSSPLSAHEACSRLSPHLAFGTVSVREVVHAVWRRRDAILGGAQDAPSGMLQALKSFESRLHWHCHFMQKLESQPDIEHHNLHAAANGLRPDPRHEPLHAARHAAWCTGHTGVPMVDACMRMLNSTGWVNFRMRAMLVAFSSYHLWHHWPAAAEHLAQQFLDYEPGIHYPQVQMQSGTTGINLPRIYNPIKQARDQDPDGQFVRRWCPELARLPLAHIFEPWSAPTSVQTEAGMVIDRDYPHPIVDLQATARHARAAIWGVRKEPVAKNQAQAIMEQHGSRSPRREASGKKSTTKKPATHAQPPRDGQLDLF